MLRLDQMINTLLQPGDYGLYGMYGVERIGVASGRKYIGGIDWGAAGAEYLVRHQNPDGSFGVEEPHKNPRKVPDTMFAILFLSRGRAPVVMNKLEYGFGAGGAQTDPWNERPRDVANFTRWTQKQLESLSRGRSSGSRQPTPICTMRRSSTSPAAQRSGSTIGKSTSSALLLKMGV
jgi:hypothetical protein